MDLGKSPTDHVPTVRVQFVDVNLCAGASIKDGDSEQTTTSRRRVPFCTSESGREINTSRGMVIFITELARQSLWLGSHFTSICIFLFEWILEDYGKKAVAISVAVSLLNAMSFSNNGWEEIYVRVEKWSVLSNQINDDCKRMV